MTNLTPIYWEANGVSLHTQRWAVTTQGGSRNSPAPRRGEDVQVPFRRGRMTSRKIVDSKVLTLPMWMAPVNDDGSTDPGLTDEQMFHKNWRYLLSKIDVDGQFDLVKRWYEGTTVKSATARAEFEDGLAPAVSGGYLAAFSIDFLLADPYFYSPVASQAIGTINVEGDVPTDHVTLSLSNGTNPRVTFPDGNWIQYTGSPGGTPVVINLQTGMSMRGSAYVNGLITRNTNFAEFPTLKPGSQALTLSGGGTGTVTYDAAYR